jgi:hypothetical protein
VILWREYRGEYGNARSVVVRLNQSMSMSYEISGSGVAVWTQFVDVVGAG